MGGQKADGRAGRRSPQFRSGDLTRRPPEEAGDLPSDEATLRYEPGRDTPVTADEALLVLRRRRRAELVRQYAEADAKSMKAAGKPATLAAALEDPAEMPTKLPPWNVRKVPVQQRLPQPLHALAVAHAEIEGSNLTAEIEMLLWKLVRQPPRDPQVVRAEYLEYLRETVGADRAKAMLDKVFGTDQ